MILVSRFALLAVAALAAGCGMLDRTVIGGTGAPENFMSTKLDQPENPQNSLADIDDPKVFMRSAARISQDAQAYKAAAAHWAGTYAADPGDKEAAVNLARNLRYIGRLEDAERVLLQGQRDHKDDLALQEEYGKVLIASGRLAKGAALLETLADAPGLDKRKVSALLAAAGVAHDRDGDHASAIARYERALRANPLNATALNNMGLSYALAGELERAEVTLREALVAPNATLQVRQNLAMVLSLRGDARGAERLASQDLPKEAAAQAVALYRDIGGKDGPWKKASAKADDE